MQDERIFGASQQHMAPADYSRQQPASNVKFPHLSVTKLPIVDVKPGAESARQRARSPVAAEMRPVCLQGPGESSLSPSLYLLSLRSFPQFHDCCLGAAGWSSHNLSGWDVNHPESTHLAAAATTNETSSVSSVFCSPPLIPSKD